MTPEEAKKAAEESSQATHEMLTSFAARYGDGPAAIVAALEKMITVSTTLITVTGQALNPSASEEDRKVLRDAMRNDLTMACSQAEAEVLNTIAAVIAAEFLKLNPLDTVHQDKFREMFNALRVIAMRGRKDTVGFLRRV